MIKVEDQIGDLIVLEKPASRIVSLVPSQTEMICDLGLEKALCGITKFCVHPGHLKDKTTVVGGTKNLHLDTIEKLKPDLVVANREENNRRDIQKLSKKIPVYVSDIASPEEGMDFATDMGELTGKTVEAEMLVDRLEFAYGELIKASANYSPKKVLYLIWKDPYMAAGTDTYISKMMEYCGLENCLQILLEKGFRYPKLEVEEIIALQPDLILFSSEPYPFKENQIRALESETEIPGKYVNGELFSWYGSRILHTLPETGEVIQEIHKISR